jgi:molybdopterin-guanine dinucleotide biosynthesis protein A
MPQVDETIINANQNLDIYARFGHRVVADEIGGYAVPLAGLHCALNVAQHGLIATVPCDSPFHPWISLRGCIRQCRHNNRNWRLPARVTSRIRCFACAADLPPHSAFAGGGRKIDACMQR